MKSQNAILKKLERIDQDFDADELYDELTQNWRYKAKQLQARRWRKVMRRQSPATS